MHVDFQVQLEGFRSQRWNSEQWRNSGLTRNYSLYNQELLPVQPRTTSCQITAMELRAVEELQSNQELLPVQPGTTSGITQELLPVQPKTTSLSEAKVFFFYLLDYVTPTEIFQIADRKRKEKDIDPICCNFYVVY